MVSDLDLPVDNNLTTRLQRATGLEVNRQEIRLYGLCEKCKIRALVAMLAILAFLLAIYLRPETSRTRSTAEDRWFFRVPFSVYLGWITAATITNAAVLLEKVGWTGFGLQPQAWTVIVIIVAALIAIAVLATRRDAAFGLVVLWALVGIVIKRSADSSVASHVVSIAAIICSAVLAAALIGSGVRSAPRPLNA